MLKLVSIDGTDPYIITLAEIKTHCHETGFDYDSMLTVLSKVAREYAEARTWKQIIPATYVLYLDQFPEGIIELPKPPVIEVSSIKYYDTDDSIQTWDEDKYQVDLESEPARIKPISSESYPSTYDRMNAVEITFKAGFDETLGSENYKIPEKIKQAELLLIKHWYDNREAVLVSEGRSIDSHEIPLTANALLDAESARVFI
ncbi:MAG: phage head-tail connector protein [Calditrichaeota bacterium]|nr:phage head-tail connector protein [Calditrichota bacterium]